MKDAIITVLSSARDKLAKDGGYLRGLRSNREKTAFCALGAIDQSLTMESAGWNRNGEWCNPAKIALAAAIPNDWWDRKQADAYNVGGVVTKDSTLQAQIACYSNMTDQATVVNWFDRAIQIQKEHPMEKSPNALP